MAAAPGIRLTGPAAAAPPVADLFGGRVERAARRFGVESPWAWLLSPAALEAARGALLRRLLQRAWAVLLDEATVTAAARRTTPLPWQGDPAPPSLAAADWQRALGGLPALEALLDRAEDDWIAGLGRLAESLAEAWPALGRDGPPTAGVIAALRPDLSDPHDGGRTAALVVLADGTPLIYKPRDLAMEQRFHALVEWLRARGAADLSCAAPVLHRTAGDGWMACVAPRPCHSAEEVATYFRRAGALLCLVALLQGTDIHRENVIACGAWPVLIDAETLFQPRLDVAALTPDLIVRDTGMVPSHGWRTRSDFSALCGRTGAATAIRLNAGTYRLPEAANLPVLDGRVHTGHDHRAQVIAGFEALHRLLVEHRGALEDELAAFADVPGRYVAAGTLRYGMAIAAGLTPEALRDPRARRAALLAGLPHPLPAGLRAEEIRALWNADVPRIGFRPGRPGPGGAWAASLDQVIGRLRALDTEGTAAWTAAIDGRLGTPRPAHDSIHDDT